jgi:hypothetical protein
VSDISNDIEDAEEFESRILDIRRDINEKLSNESPRTTNEELSTDVSTTEQPQIVQVNHTTTEISEQSPATSQASQNTATLSGTVQQPVISNDYNLVPTTGQPQSKLPKLVLPKFRGEITQWRTFWDSFNSAIYTNAQLSKIDKFNHLKSLLEGQAIRAIQGLALSENNYQAAIDILHQRFGNTQQIILTHMDELLKLPTCSGERASQLRFLYDKISINVRGLEALGVNSSQYGSLLIPVVMSKLPQEVRIQIARKTTQEVWEMSPLLEVIQREVEAREISEGVKLTQEKPKSQTPKFPNASQFMVSGSRTGEIQIQCIYCSENHYSASCTKVTEPSDRLEILRKKGRCFVCLKSGHRSNQCSSTKSCRRCKGRHHQSICNHHAPKEPVTPSRQFQPTQGHSTNQGQALTEKINTPDAHTFHVQESKPRRANTIGGVMLQTATATATNEDATRSTKVKILFDSGSQRSYISDKLKSRLNLQPETTETLHLNTFGERNYR